MLDSNLNTVANLLQIATFLMTLTESSNDKLMQELQHQNKDYLEIIIKQNNEILEKLNNGQRRNNKEN